MIDSARNDDQLATGTHAAPRGLERVPRHAPIVELPPPDSSLLGRVLGVEGVRSQVTGLLPGELLELVQAAAPFMLYSPDEPMALMELVEIGP